MVFFGEIRDSVEHYFRLGLLINNGHTPLEGAGLTKFPTKPVVGSKLTHWVFIRPFKKAVALNIKKAPGYQPGAFGVFSADDRT